MLPQKTSKTQDKETAWNVKRVNKMTEETQGKTQNPMDNQAKNKATTEILLTTMAGYQLYHHAFFISEEGKWAVVQQGMCPEDRTARRYHWLSTSVKSFVVEPHKAIVGDARRQVVLDMTAKQSEECRKTSVDVVRENPKKIMRMVVTSRPAFQKSLQDWFPRTAKSSLKQSSVEFLSMPMNINWKALQEVY